MISSMVIPPNPTPNIIEIHRKHVVLSWEAVYYPTSQDKTKYGVNITICHARIFSSDKISNEISQTSSLGDENIKDCFVVVKEKNDLIEINNFQKKDQIKISTVVNNLNSSTEYQIRLYILKLLFLLLIYYYY